MSAGNKTLKFICVGGSVTFELKVDIFATKEQIAAPGFNMNCTIQETTGLTPTLIASGFNFPLTATSFGDIFATAQQSVLFDELWVYDDSGSIQLV